MAITFSEQLSTVKLLNAYNNNVVKFSSDNILDATKCVINIGGSNFTISPNTTNLFRFDFKEIVTVLLNNNFEDLITPTTDLIQDDSLNIIELVTYTITFTDLSTEQTTATYVFVKSIEQIANVSNRLIINQHLLTPNKLTFFKGFPFDITHYSDGLLTITNKTNLKIKQLSETETDTFRIFFLNELNQFKNRVENDGGTYETNSCFIDGLNYEILDLGFNNLEFSGTTIENIIINLKEDCKGTYLRWFNAKGGFSYWLFNDVHRERKRITAEDTFSVDFESIDNTFETNLITGKKSEKERTLHYDSLTQDESIQIQSILSSPRVELYNGEKDKEISTWQTVVLKNGRFLTDDTKTDLTNIIFTIEINDYTQL